MKIINRKFWLIPNGKSVDFQIYSHPPFIMNIFSIQQNTKLILSIEWILNIIHGIFKTDHCRRYGFCIFKPISLWIWQWSHFEINLQLWHRVLIKYHDRLALSEVLHSKILLQLNIWQSKIWLFVKPALNIRKLAYSYAIRCTKHDVSNITTGNISSNQLLLSGKYRFDKVWICERNIFEVSRKIRSRYQKRMCKTLKLEFNCR